MSKKLVFFPSDPIIAYIEKGKTYKQLEEYYNPGDYFDEVYCLSPWGECDEKVIGKIHYIKADVLEFKKIIKKIHPDIVRGYGGYCCADWASISKVKDIPFVISVHDTNPNLIHDSLKYADALIFMSTAVRDAVFKKVNICHDNTFIMGNRIDTNIFKKKSDDIYFDQLNKKYGYGKHILHIGRKDEQKNIETVIRAMQYLGDDYKCIFIGKGDSAKYQEIAKSCGCENRCFFEQSVSNCELPYWYSWCDYFVVPSRWEGFGVVFIEAAACETLIITSDIAPMNEFLKNGENAILIKDYENPRAIADAILSTENQNLKSLSLKRNAREVGLRFSKDIIDKQEIAIYEKVLSIKANNCVNKELRKKMHPSMKTKVNSFILKLKSKVRCGRRKNNA